MFVLDLKTCVKFFGCSKSFLAKGEDGSRSCLGTLMGVPRCPAYRMCSSIWTHTRSHRDDHHQYHHHALCSLNKTHMAAHKELQTTTSIIITHCAHLTKRIWQHTRNCRRFATVYGATARLSNKTFKCTRNLSAKN